MSDAADVMAPAPVDPASPARVIAVSRSSGHTFSKPMVESISLLAGLGVEGDAHCGTTVKHRSRVAKDPTVPNLRQVHLVAGELHDEAAAAGYSVGPGDMGENVTTRGVDLLGLPIGTRLRLGDDAVVELTGLRNPCGQLNSIGVGFQGLMLDYDADGRLIRKAGVMSVVIEGGIVRAGDAIEITLPAGPHVALQPV